MQSSAEQVAAVYEALRADDNPVHRVGWVSRLQQYTCFEILVGIADLSACSVLDAGCGTGDLYSFLRARGFHGTYTGIDLVASSIAEARVRYPDATWLTGDLLTTQLAAHDYVLASGLLDVRTPDSHERVRVLLHRGFGLCRRGMAWNMFSILPPEHSERLYVEPLGDLLDVCNQITPWFTLRRDYSPGHFTLYLYRREHFVTPALQAVIGHVYVDADFRLELARAPEQVAQAYGLSFQQLKLLESLL
ncbi:MAG TPA: class I SAM-dependent methyltransferase [Anaerolineae bacterium]|nr:class I SAM-dependent methyltransferase [Anaerolineae bacterium]